MPLVSSTYRPPFLFRSAHYATVWCGLYRKVDVPQVRERIILEDGDFLDLDWSFASQERQEARDKRQDARHFSIQPQPGFDSSRYDLRSTRRTSQPEGPVESLEVRARDEFINEDKTVASDSPNPRSTLRQAQGNAVNDQPFDRPRATPSTRSHQAAILLHGLEGHGQRPYITGNARWLNQNGIDACAVNFRGCSGETNKLYRSYHSGATEDLDAVVRHVLEKGYSAVYLVGISLGGNMLLKYLGEERDIAGEVKAGVAICAPCDLYASLQCIMSFENTLYARRFRKHLVEKLYRKQKLYPDHLSNGTIKQIKTLKDFDDVYTSKAHGFTDAMDYYTQCSSKQFLPTLKRPALILNAKDDTFLKGGCYPVAEAERYAHVYLEMPKWGGHVGFVGKDNVSYAERRVLEFIREKVNR